MYGLDQSSIAFGYVYFLFLYMGMKRKMVTVPASKKKVYKKKRYSKVTGYNALQRVLTKYWDRNYYPLNITVAPQLFNLTTGLGLGAGPTQYVGTSITPLCLTIRFMAYVTTDVVYTRFMVIQILTSAVPAAADILEIVGAYPIIAPIKHQAKDDILVLRDFTFQSNLDQATSAGGPSTLLPEHFKIYIKGKNMVKISGIDSGALTNGNIYVVLVSDRNNFSSLNFVSRLEFKDT